MLIQHKEWVLPLCFESNLTMHQLLLLRLVFSRLNLQLTNPKNLTELSPNLFARLTERGCFFLSEGSCSNDEFVTKSVLYNNGTATSSPKPTSTASPSPKGA